jgi:hypothetical protein
LGSVDTGAEAAKAFVLEFAQVHSEEVSGREGARANSAEEARGVWGMAEEASGCGGALDKKRDGARVGSEEALGRQGARVNPGDVSGFEGARANSAEEAWRSQALGAWPRKPPGATALWTRSATALGSAPMRPWGVRALGSTPRMFRGVRTLGPTLLRRLGGARRSGRLC